MKNEFRKTYEMLVKDVIGTITVFVESQPVEKIYLDDKDGSLIINAIDDQASEVIQCIEHRGDVITLWSGVFDEDRAWSLEDFDIEKLLNILDAVEEAYDALEEKQ
jgi:hypothetical protein